MKKIIKKHLFILCSFLIVTQIHAQNAPTCIGGKLVTSNVYTSANAPASCNQDTCPEARTFCVSDKEMNWWSAFNWCKSNHRQLATFERVCPGVRYQERGTCPALQGIGGSFWSWIAAGWGTNYAQNLQLSTGSFDGNASRNVTEHALCE